MVINKLYIYVYVYIYTYVYVYIYTHTHNLWQSKTEVWRTGTIFLISPADGGKVLLVALAAESLAAGWMRMTPENPARWCYINILTCYINILICFINILICFINILICYINILICYINILMCYINIILINIICHVNPAHDTDETALMCDLDFFGRISPPRIPTKNAMVSIANS